MNRTAVGTVLAVAAFAAGATAFAASDLPVLTGSANQALPAAGEGYFAWTIIPRRSRARSVVWARFGTEPAFRVNATNVSAYTGGISGTTLVYQETSGTRSDIRLYSLASRANLTNPPGLNTTRWEWGPTISGDWVMFSRGSQGVQGARIVLRNIRTGEERTLDTGTRRIDLTPGQVNGEFAVWTRCVKNGGCSVFLYRLGNGIKTRLEKQAGRIEYAPSVLADGTVFFVRSGPRCGQRVSIWKLGSAGYKTLHELPNGFDVVTTYATVESGLPSLYYEKAGCARTSNSDVYKIAMTAED